nr:hypothetical protein [Legionellales bacterium]
MKRIRLGRWCGGLLLVSLLTGCAALKPIDLQLNNFALTEVATQSYARQPQPITVLVAHPIAAAGYQSKYMLYTEQPYELKVFAKNQWIAPPAKMLLPLLAESLTNSGYFAAVMIPPYVGRNDLRVETTLLQLEQAFNASPHAVRMALQVTVIDTRSRTVLTSQTLRTEVPTPQDNPAGGVAAANAVTQALLNRMV